MAAKKAVATRATAKPAVVKDPLTAEAIMKKYRLQPDGNYGYQEAEQADVDDFAFFENVSSLPFTCAVFVIGEFIDFDDLNDLPFTEAEATVLFKHAVKWVLDAEQRKQLIATTNNNQDHIEPLLKAAGFINAGTSKNPGSRNDVTIWVLSI